jgi:S-adenosylmethionine hydrolase
MSLITLLTDFGTSDYYVGAMKGVILGICPDARIVDITHEIPPQDIQTAAFTLLAAYKSFPKGTIHVAVVDPGVGSDRKPILIQSRDYFFIAPDNGLLSFIAENEKETQVFHLTNEKYFNSPVSATFHGRDVFAPVAAQLACGVNPEELGKAINDFVRLQPLKPEIEGDNVSPSNLTEKMFERGFVVKIGEHEIGKLQNFYAEANAEGDIFIIEGSASFFEIVSFKDSAARLLGAKLLQEIAFVPKA